MSIYVNHWKNMDWPLKSRGFLWCFPSSHENGMRSSSGPKNLSRSSAWGTSDGNCLHRPMKSWWKNGLETQKMRWFSFSRSGVPRDPFEKSDIIHHQYFFGGEIFWHCETKWPPISFGIKSIIDCPENHLGGTTRFFHDFTVVDLNMEKRNENKNETYYGWT